MNKNTPSLVHGIERLPQDADKQPTPRAYRFLTLAEVLREISVSRSTWYDGIKKGIYPRGYSLGARRVGWRSCDIEDLKQRFVEQC